MTKKYFKFIILFALVLFLSVGYAVVSSVNLTITGSVTGESRDLKVYFEGTVDKSNATKVTASASNRTGSASITNMTLNETVTIEYLINNDETDVNANLDVTYTPSNSYFDINVTNRTSGDLSVPTFNVIDNDYEVLPVAVWLKNANFDINAGAKMWLIVTVKMIKTPVTEADSKFDFNINIDASPVSATA